MLLYTYNKTLICIYSIGGIIETDEIPDIMLRNVFADAR